MDVKSISNVKRIPSLQSLQWGFMSDMAAMNGGAGCALYNSRQYHSPFSFCTQYAQCWMKHKLKSRLLGEISISSDTQMTPPFRKWRRTKEPLDESERGAWKSWLKTQHSKNKDHGIQSLYFMENRWGNNGKNKRCFGLKNHHRWWLQPWNYKMLAPWKKSYDQPRQHNKKQRLFLPTKVHLVKAMVFPVVVYGCESWKIKKAEH